MKTLMTINPGLKIIVRFQKDLSYSGRHFLS